MSLKSQKKGPAFLLKTFDMLEKQQFKQIIDWIPDGTGFVVKSPNQLAQKVLPKYFKHSNMHSFIRQLNMYGFNKKRGSKTQNYYFHPLFHKGKRYCICHKIRDIICEMQRKAEKKGTQKELTKEEINEDVSIQVEEESHQQNKQNKNHLSEAIVSQSHRRKQLNSQLEESQIKKNVVELAAMNKVLLLEQIYHLANIQANNLLTYHQKMQDSENQEETTETFKCQLLEKFKKIKNQYLQIHSLIWDRISPIAQNYQFEILKNSQALSKDAKPTQLQINKKQQQKNENLIEHPQSQDFSSQKEIKVEQNVLSENQIDQNRQKQEISN